jgi:two-component system chemotaxis response regulator CheB
MLPGDLPAAVFVVLHTSPESPNLLPEILRRTGNLPASSPADGDPIEQGRIYVAPPDHHLLVEPNRIRVVRGPKENRHRPAVDPLFRSAAWAFGPRVVGVILSGALDDGTAGMWAVKTCGGITVVQDPEDALYPSMPISAMAYVRIDHCLPLSGLGPLLVRLANEPARAPGPKTPPETIALETDFAKLEGEIRVMKALGTPSAFTCPTCQGSLWESQDGELLRYRCHVGHAFSPESLLAEQSETVENALYSSLRALEEKAAMYRRLADRLSAKVPMQKAGIEEKARALDASAQVIRDLLVSNKAG